MKTYIATLGCPKNLVDTEASMALLRRSGCSIVDDPGEAELLIVSACSFLEAAWQETVDEAQRLAEFKQKSNGKKLVMMGCLPKHHDTNLSATLPFVDRFVPTGAHSLLPEIVDAWRRGDTAPATPPSRTFDRFAGFEDRGLLTPSHTAYVKIAEGCNRTCSFCAIPAIRGRMVSRPVESIVREVHNLMAGGVKEVCLLAQDITSYHSDGKRFPDLVSAVAATGVEWIRIFYVHPGSLDIGLARLLFAHPSVCRYLEVPVQHASDRILGRMRRHYTRRRLEDVFGAIRREFPDVMIRSEVIVGFPGETDDEFEELASFIENAGFASVGVFPYSPEPGTRAAGLDGAVPEAVKRERVAELTNVQEAVSFGLLSSQRGRRCHILVDRSLDRTHDVYRDCSHAGRFYGQAYDIDGEVFLKGGNIEIGHFVDARIDDAGVYDLRGNVL